MINKKTDVFEYNEQKRCKLAQGIGYLPADESTFSHLRILIVDPAVSVRKLAVMSAANFLGTPWQGEVHELLKSVSRLDDDLIIRAAATVECLKFAPQGRF